MPVTRPPSELAYAAHKALYEGISRDRVEQGLPTLPPFPEPQPEVWLTAKEFLARHNLGKQGQPSRPPEGEPER